MSFRRFHYVLTPDVLVLALVVLPPCVLGILVVLEVEAAGILTAPLDIITLRPTLLRLLGWSQLLQVRHVGIDTRVVLLAE